MKINSEVIKNTINNENIFNVFQPIINLKTRRTVAVESLCRGIFKNEIIPPYYLFEYAAKLGGNMPLKLELISQKKAIRDFFNHPVAPMLVLNISQDILSSTDDFSDIPLNHLHHPDISPKSIVLETPYVCAENAKFCAFLQYMRFCGHQISLDSIDDNPECLAAISKIRPDYVKIDRDFVVDIEHDREKQELLNSICEISKKYGSYTIAEGVETVQEVTACMMCGVDLVQGFYFTEPVKLDEFPEEQIMNKINTAANNITESIINKYANERIRKLTSKELIHELLILLSEAEESEYENIMYSYIKEYPEIECIFLIGANGIQISDTIISADSIPEDSLSVYAPAVIGDSHSLKNYFYAVIEDIENPFISDKYISDATGNMCITVSSKFTNKNRKKIVVCIDIKAR